MCASKWFAPFRENRMGRATKTVSVTSHPVAHIRWRILGVYSNSPGWPHLKVSICSLFNLIAVKEKQVTYYRNLDFFLSSGLQKSPGYKVPVIAHCFVCLCTKRTANRNFNSIYLDCPWLRADTQYQLKRLKPATKCWARERRTRLRFTMLPLTWAVNPVSCVSVERKSKEIWLCSCQIEVNE